MLILMVGQVHQVGLVVVVLRLLVQHLLLEMLVELLNQDRVTWEVLVKIMEEVMLQAEVVVVLVLLEIQHLLQVEVLTEV